MTPIYTILHQKEGQLINEHIKGPLFAAIRSPLMEALGGSVKKLDLSIVTSRLDSLNL